MSLISTYEKFTHINEEFIAFIDKLGIKDFTPEQKARLNQKYHEYMTPIKSKDEINKINNMLVDYVTNFDENKAIYATNKIKKAASWNTSIDNYNYLKQGIAEADKILEDLDLDEDSEILAFLKLVSEGKATILNLTDEILNWIKTENLADKLYINF